MRARPSSARKLKFLAFFGQFLAFFLSVYFFDIIQQTIGHRPRFRGRWTRMDVNLDAWFGSGSKNLECNVFVTLKSWNSKAKLVFHYQTTKIRVPGGFWWRGIVCEQYFWCLDRPWAQNLNCNVFVTLKSWFLRKSRFFTISRPKFEYHGVFGGRESLASNIFDAWVNPGSKNLECNVFVTLQSWNFK